MPPFRQGGLGDEGMRIATASVRTGFAMTHYRKCYGYRAAGWGHPAPTEAQQEVQWAGDRKGRPYESVTRGCRGERNPPVTASPCQPSLGKGAMGTGEADVPVAVPKISTLPYGGRWKF